MNILCLYSELAWVKSMYMYMYKQNVIIHIINDCPYSIVRPANRDRACQTERCHTLSNKTSLQ